MDIDVWMNDLIDQLKIEFKERLVLVGLQGSRARGEQREDSDIDAVVIVEDLDADDLALYRSIVQRMPHAELACGFIGSPDALAAWPRHDVFNLVNDTSIRYGSFYFMDTEFTAEEAKLAADTCALPYSGVRTGYTSSPIARLLEVSVLRDPCKAFCPDRRVREQSRTAIETSKRRRKEALTSLQWKRTDG